MRRWILHALPLRFRQNGDNRHTAPLNLHTRLNHSRAVFLGASHCGGCHCASQPIRLLFLHPLSLLLPPPNSFLSSLSSRHDHQRPSLTSCLGVWRPRSLSHSLRAGTCFPPSFQALPLPLSIFHPQAGSFFCSHRPSCQTCT